MREWGRGEVAERRLRWLKEAIVEERAGRGDWEGRLEEVGGGVRVGVEGGAPPPVGAGDMGMTRGLVANESWRIQSSKSSWDVKANVRAARIG